MNDQLDLMGSIDLDGDGIPDAFDLDGDGTLDGFVSYVDINGDGAADALGLGLDLDGDGLTDASFAVVDLDGDGTAESLVPYGDTVFEADRIFDSGEWDFGGEQGEAWMGEPASEVSLSAIYDQFDPAETDMSQVVGSPVQDEAAWDYQGESGPCAIYAQCMAYENMTGVDVDVERMIEVAEDQGWYDGGTTMQDMDKVLEYLGAETTSGSDGTLEDVRTCLENDGRMVVAVDGNELWEGNSLLYLPNDPNHAVEVIGIDYTDAEPMVILNDSGTPDGHAVQVPASQFMDAWADSGFYYVEAYA